MNKSNIITGSNIHFSKTDNPRWDPDYIKQITDPYLLKKIKERRFIDSRIAPLSTVQISITEQDLRCKEAENDPCWGYKNGKEHCVCINGNCPMMMIECNKNYTKEYELTWTMSEKERNRYGDPKKLREYYLVDLVSDDEMQRYYSLPTEGQIYPFPPNPISLGEGDKPEVKTKIDPVTGRRMELVGHKWLIDGTDASYESEHLVEIWDYVIDDKRNKPIKKSKSIEQNTVDGLINESKRFTNFENPIVNTTSIEGKEKTHISGEVKIVDLDSALFKGKKTTIVLDNPAEMAYVSHILLVNGVEHGFEENQVRLVLIENYYSDYTVDNILVSTTVLNTCSKAETKNGWNSLANEDKIWQLKIPDREYYKLIFNNNECRWCCKNLYGVTHICIQNDDIDYIDIEDGTYEIDILYKDKFYEIQLTNGAVIGRLKESFTDIIRNLIDNDEISGMPSFIKGIVIQVANKETIIKGIGSLVFDEY